MSAIHVKDSILKSLPNIFHPIAPPLFVESGKMPCRDKNKDKSAVIYINLCGVYFLRPISFSKKYKLSQFISTYDISEIDYQDKLQCEIITKSRSLFIHCDHCEEAVGYILSARRLLFKDMKENYKIQVIGFPSPPPSPNIQVSPEVSIVTLRYIAMCSKRNFIPEGRILDVFNKFNPATHVTLTLDELCVAPPVVKNLMFPMYSFRHIQILRFKNFSPYFVCRFIHHLIKRGFKVDSIIMEGYSYIVPEQLRLEKTRGFRPLCLVFKNCNFSDEINNKLFEQLGNYPGEISRISFINCSISAAGWKSLFDTITQSRSFKELEEFEINNINSNAFYDNQVIDGVKELLKHCRFIMKLSVSNWTQPIHFGINNFQNYLLLSEINLAGQDMTQPLPDDFKMLRMVHCLNLSRCNFTFNSLQSLFKVISTARSAIALRLADIKLPDAHWKNLYSSLSSFPPLNSLCELDWSGNSLYSEDISNFANYFFAGNKLRFLQIDRVFGSQQAEDLQNLLRCLTGKPIVGLSIGGSPERNFGGNLKSLLKAIELIMNLHILHIDGQKITDLDVASLLDYLKIQRTLNDVSFDDTCINDQQRFFEFYKDICSLNIDAVGRPFRDMNRLFGSDLSNVINPSHYDEFQSQIRLKSDLISDSCREFYICKFLGSEFDPKIYLWFGECYPASFFDEGRYDTFGLKKENMRHPMPSLCAISHKHLLRNLSQYHMRYLVPPERLPRYRIKLDNFEPKFLVDSTTNEQSFAYLNKEVNYDDELATTGHFGFGFGTILSGQNFDDLYNTQNLYDTQQYDQTNFDQQPIYDQTEQFDQYDQQQFDNQKFDMQNDQLQFDQQQGNQEFVPEPQFDQQQYNQNQFDQQQQFVPPQFDQNQFDQQQYSQQQYQQDLSYDQTQQYSHEQFDQAQFQQPQFLQEPYDPNQFQQQQFAQEPYDPTQFQQQQFAQEQYDSTQFQQQQFTQEKYDPINLNPVQPAEIQQQQPVQQKSSEDFTKTLNRFMSHNVIDYEDQSPELPSLRSDLHEPAVKQPNEVTEVKPLLQCTIKPRDKTIEQPSNLPPPMFPLTQETSTDSSSAFTIPPPSNLDFPAPLTNNQPFIPAPVPLTPAQQITPKPIEPIQQKQETQPPLTVPTPTPLMKNITVIPPPNQPVQQQTPPPIIQDIQQPSEPKVTVEKTVTITETTMNNKPKEQEPVKVPDLGAPALSPTPPTFNQMIPQPVTQQPKPQPPPQQTPSIPAAPPKKKKRANFQSAAGPIRVQSTIGLGSSNNLPKAARKVKVDGGKEVDIPDETTLKAPEPVHNWKSFDDIEVPDLAVTSNAASRQEVPKLIVIDTPVSVENFYQSDSIPFNLPQPKYTIPIGSMSHPLQARVFLKPPNIRILGVPEEW